jgi:hypothetical protein
MFGTLDKDNIVSIVLENEQSENMQFNIVSI